VIVTLRPVTVADLAVEPHPSRSTGLHVSTIIKAICKGLEPERFGGEITNWTPIEMGFTVERAIESAWASRRIDVWRPGEMEKDGIVGSPDGVTFDSDGAIVDEIKCTWMSSKGCPEDKKFWHWLVQIKAYCHLLDTIRARLHVVFVNGNYSDHREPQYCSWDLRFHGGEIDENWMMLVNQAAVLRREQT